MANQSKAKGTRAETRVARYLEGKGWCATRQPLSGNKDKGDILATSPGGDRRYIVEVKAGQQCANPSRSDLEKWMEQAKVEARNNWPKMSCTENKWILVVVRYGRSIDNADVYTMNGYRRIEHCWLDQINGILYK